MSGSEDLPTDEHGRPEPPPAGDEVSTLFGFLDFQRATLAWKTADLDGGGLDTRVAASTMTLGGLLKHMAYVEDSWFSQWFYGHDRHALWTRVDWKADPDWEWHSAAGDTPDQLRQMWHDAVVRSRELCRQALADAGLEQLSQRKWADGRTVSLRWIVVHMIEEYARHNGHADLIRESIDGQTGE